MNPSGVIFWIPSNFKKHCCIIIYRFIPKGFDNLELRDRFHYNNAVHMMLGMQLNMSYHGWWLIGGQSEILLYYSSVESLNERIVEEKGNHQRKWNIYPDGYKTRAKRAGVKVLDLMYIL